MVGNRKAQMKIQQMAFMILAVFLFFVLVGLFFLSYQYKVLKSKASDLEREQAISSLVTITNMPEISCGHLCLDEDKLEVMLKEDYSKIWPVQSIKVYKLYPFSNKTVNCPAPDCNFYGVYNSNQKEISEESTYITLCRKDQKNSYIYDNCKIAKLVVGMRIVT